MSNFPSNASYGHASAEAQPGNPPAHTVIDLSRILTPVHRLDIAVTNAYAFRSSHVENFLHAQVGTEFSRQFYFVLTQQPSLAHRFYTDGSSLTHSTGGAGVTVYGQTVWA